MKKPTYTDTLLSLNTHILYIREHLENVDIHLEKLNDRVWKNEIQTARNTTRLGLAFKVFGGLLTTAAIVIPILFVTGVF